MSIKTSSTESGLTADGLRASVPVSETHHDSGSADAESESFEGPPRGAESMREGTRLVNGMTDA